MRPNALCAKDCTSPRQQPIPLLPPMLTKPLLEIERGPASSRPRTTPLKQNVKSSAAHVVSNVVSSPSPSGTPRLRSQMGGSARATDAPKAAANRTDEVHLDGFTTHLLLRPSDLTRALEARSSRAPSPSTPARSSAHGNGCGGKGFRGVARETWSRGLA